MNRDQQVERHTIIQHIAAANEKTLELEVCESEGEPVIVLAYVLPLEYALLRREHGGAISLLRAARYEERDDLFALLLAVGHEVRRWDRPVVGCSILPKVHGIRAGAFGRGSCGSS